MREIFPGEAPGIVNFSQSQFLQLLESLIGHPRVQFGKREHVVIHSRGPRQPLRLAGERIVVKPGNLKSWHLEGADFRPLAPGLPSKYESLLSSGLRVSAAEARFVLSRLEQWFDIPEALWESLPEEGMPEVVIHLEGSLRHLEARLEFYYDGRKASCENGEPQLVGGFLTSLSKENAVIEFFHSWGFEGPAKGGRMALREREEILKFHAFADLPTSWRVEKGERFQAAAEQVVAVKPDWEWKTSGQDWFAVETKYRVGNEELEREQVQRMLRMGSAEQAFGRGQIAVVDADYINEVNETLTDSDALQNSPGVFEINSQQAAFLKASARDFGMAVAEDQPVDLELPDCLRPYQAEGVRWLYKLSELGMGGILADDMGLGKTLQTLTFIQKRGGQALVVCPSSLVSNWAAEAQKWVPDFEGGLPRGREAGSCSGGGYRDYELRHSENRYREVSSEDIRYRGAR